MDVRIDLARCKAHKTCNEICPEVYRLDEWGYAFVEAATVPADLEEAALRGALSCPEEAIIVEGV